MNVYGYKTTIGTVIVIQTIIKPLFTQTLYYIVTVNQLAFVAVKCFSRSREYSDPKPDFHAHCQQFSSISSW